MDSQEQADPSRPRRTPEEFLPEIAAFTSTSLAFTIALLNRVLRDWTTLQTRDAGAQSGEVYNLIANNASRKRKRDASVTFQLNIHFRNLLRSFMVFHREIHCPWYIKPRTPSWYRLYIDWVPGDDPKRFKDFFRVSVSLFELICEKVKIDMITNPPRAFANLPNRTLLVPRQVAIAIRRLSIGDQVLGIGELFGVSASTVVKCTWKFIKAVNKNFREEIKWPTGDSLWQVKAGFQGKGFPNCCGAVDGTHFPVELPRGERSVDYYDYKHNVSVSLQAIVDVNCRFLDVCCGWPGSIQDSRLMRNSGFYRDVVYRKEKLAGPVFHCLNGGQLREYLLADDLHIH